MFYLFVHPRFAQYILAHSPSHRLTHNPKMAQDLVQDGGGSWDYDYVGLAWLLSVPGWPQPKSPTHNVRPGLANWEQ